MNLGRWVDLALACIRRESPHAAEPRLPAEEDLPIRALHPTFHGCYDWHSAVHNHWLLARAARTEPDAEWAPRASEALEESLERSRLVREAHFFFAPERRRWECPYGAAWVLTLALELAEWDDPRARRWSDALRPLESVARTQLGQWAQEMKEPDQSGLHGQAAFSMGLAIDYAEVRNPSWFLWRFARKTRALFFEDRTGTLHQEPGPHDFLSPSLAVADLGRRVFAKDEYAKWLGRWVPVAPGFLTPAKNPDPSDYRGSHLDGLNLSRAWMLDGIADGLPARDSRIPILRETARLHGVAGLAAISSEHYAGAHWLGSFAVYYLTARGRRLRPELHS